jgi:hypothetical protein
MYPFVFEGSELDLNTTFLRSLTTGDFLFFESSLAILEAIFLYEVLNPSD